MKPSVNFLINRFSFLKQLPIFVVIYSSEESENKDFESTINFLLMLRNKEANYDSDLSDDDLALSYTFDHYMYALMNGFGNIKLLENKERSFKLLKIYVKKLMKEIVENKNYLLFDRFLIFSLDFNKLKEIPGINESDINELISAKREYDDYNEKLLSKYKNWDALTDDEMKYLTKFFIGRVPTNDDELKKIQKEFFDSCLMKLIKLPSSDMKNVDKDILNFITKYVFFDCLDQGLSKNHAARKDANGVFLFCSTFKTNPDSYAYVSSNLFSSFNWSKFSNLSFHLAAVAHEARHFLQSTILSNFFIDSIKVENEISSVLRNYGDKKNGTSDYRFNYFNQEIEIDADKYGYFYSRNLMEELRKQESTSILAEKIKKMISYFDLEYHKCELEEYSVMRNRSTLDGTLQYPWNYKFENLDKIMHAHSELLQKYDSLEIFYNQNGSSRSLFDVFTRTQNLFGDSHNYISNIYLDFCRYRISKGDFELLFDSSSLNEIQKSDLQNNFIRMFRCFEEDKKRLLDTLKKDFSKGKFNQGNFDVIFSKLECDFQVISKSILFCSNEESLIDALLRFSNFKNTLFYIDEIVNLFLIDINKTLNDIVKNIDKYDSNKLVFDKDSAFNVLKKSIDKIKRIMLLKTQIHNGNYDEQFGKLYDSISVISNKIVARCKDSKEKIEKSSFAKEPIHMRILEIYNNSIVFCQDPFVGTQVSELGMLYYSASEEQSKIKDDSRYELFIKSLYSKYESFKCSVNFIECSLYEEVLSTKYKNDIVSFSSKFINLIESIPESFRINNLKILEMLSYFRYVQEKFLYSNDFVSTKSCVEFSKRIDSEKQFNGRKK